MQFGRGGGGWSGILSVKVILGVQWYRYSGYRYSVQTAVQFYMHLSLHKAATP
jgi:hypothetical protein